MPKLFQSTVIAVAALMTCMAAFQAQADLHSRAEPFNAASAADIDQNYLVEVGVARRGEALHAFLSGSREPRLVSGRLSYSFISSKDESPRPPDTTVRAAIEAQIATEATARSKGLISAKNISAPSDPNPPDGFGRIGQGTSTISQCTTARRGFDTLTADVTYDYVYRYTVDTNRDGKNDSEPGWVLEGVRVTFLQRNVAELCT